MQEVNNIDKKNNPFGNRQNSKENLRHSRNTSNILKTTSQDKLFQIQLEEKHNDNYSNEKNQSPLTGSQNDEKIHSKEYYLHINLNNIKDGAGSSILPQ